MLIKTKNIFLNGQILNRSFEERKQFIGWFQIKLSTCIMVDMKIILIEFRISIQAFFEMFLHV